MASKEFTSDSKSILYTNNMAEVVKAMNTIVCALNDESPYYSWISIVPDEADDNDFEYIANDTMKIEGTTLLDDTIAMFRSIVKQYMK